MSARKMSGDIHEMSRLELHRDIVCHGTLQKAVCDGREDLLDDLLKCCTEDQINSLDKQGCAALHYAVKSGSVSMIKKLLEAKCDPDVCTKNNLTPLHIAAGYLSQGRTKGMEPDFASDKKSTGHQVIRMLLEADGKSALERLSVGRLDTGVKGTPLHVACCRANEPAVHELLKNIQKVDAKNIVVNMMDIIGSTPLHEACIHGNLSIVKELMNHGADPNAQNVHFGEGKTPLQTACIGGYVAVVKTILDHNTPRITELVEARARGSRNTVMHFAAENGDLEMVKVLLEYGANPSAQNIVKEAPVHIVVGLGYTDIARVLLDCDSSCKDLLDKQHRSPLHYAARNNQVEIIELLLSKRCNKELLDKDSVSPLLLSVKSGKANAVRALISGGCDVNTKDRDGKSTVFWAVQKGYIDVLTVLLTDMRGILLVHVPEPSHLDTPFHSAAEMVSAEAIKLLAVHLGEHLHLQLNQLSEEIYKERKKIDESGLSATGRLQVLEQERDDMEVLRVKMQHLDFRNDEHKTPLHFAARSGNIDVVRFLVHNYPPCLTHLDDDCNTALHLAVHHGRTEVAGFLIQEGAKVDARDWYDNTPLHLAANGCHAEIVSLLVKADAPLEATETYYKTPLHVAAEEGHTEIISLLTDAGAQLEAKDNRKTTPLFWACSNGHLAAVKVLMEKGADVTAQNMMKLNCLDAAVTRGHGDVIFAIIHSEQWKKALCPSGCLMTPFRRMIQEMPYDVLTSGVVQIKLSTHEQGLLSPMSAAEAVLDRCVTTSNEYDLNKTMVWVNFSYEFLDDICVEPSEESLIEWRPKGSAKDHPLALMVKYKRENLLRHPVVTSLLEHKWRKYGAALFLINLITYLIFVIFLTTYALLLPHPDYTFCHEFTITQSVASLPLNGSVCPFEVAYANRSNVFNIDSTVPMDIHANVALYFAAVVVIITAAARLLFVELVQCAMTRFHYFLNVENYIDILAYLLSLIFVSHFGTNCWCSTRWQWQLGSIGVFLTWINLILFLKRIPLLGIYVLMFNAILHSFLKFALVPVLFVMAFASGFYMILYKASLGYSIVRTIVMTIGEFDFESTFGQTNDSRNMVTSFPEAAYLLWIIFLIVMPILVTNLLVGLAVGDIKTIRDEAELRSNLLQIEADELLPDRIRNMFRWEHRTIYYHHQKMVNKSRLVHVQRWLHFWWGGILKKIWGGERWDSRDNMRKCKKRGYERQLTSMQSSDDLVKSQTEQLCREVRSLMEKHNRTEQLLVMAAGKLGIDLDSDRPPHPPP